MCPLASSSTCACPGPWQLSHPWTAAGVARILRLPVLRAFERVLLVGVARDAGVASDIAGRRRRRLCGGPAACGCLGDGELLTCPGGGLGAPPDAHRHRDCPDPDRPEPPSELHVSTSSARAWHSVSPTGCALVHTPEGTCPKREQGIQHASPTGGRLSPGIRQGLERCDRTSGRTSPRIASNMSESERSRILFKSVPRRMMRHGMKLAGAGSFRTNRERNRHE